MIRPKDVRPIFRIKEFRNHGSFTNSLFLLKNKQGTGELLKNKYLAKEPYDLEKLNALPEGTLGNEFATYMKHFELDVVFYPDDIKDQTKDDISWVRYRARETHDVWHVVLGIKPDLLGEMKISAVYVNQFNSPLNVFLIGVGVFYALIKKPYMIQELFTHIADGLKIGKEAKDLMAVRWEDLWEKDIKEIRKELNILGVTTEARFQETFEEIEEREERYFKSAQV